jgi:hypothetical protein
MFGLLLIYPFAHIYLWVIVNGLRKQIQGVQMAVMPMTYGQPVGFYNHEQQQPMHYHQKMVPQPVGLYNQQQQQQQPMIQHQMVAYQQQPMHI